MLQTRLGAPAHPLTLTFMEEEIKTCGSPGLLSSSLGVCLPRWPTGHAIRLCTVPVARCLLTCTPPPFVHPCSLPSSQLSADVVSQAHFSDPLHSPNFRIGNNLKCSSQTVSGDTASLSSQTIQRELRGRSEPWIPPGQSDNFPCSDPHSNTMKEKT